ncbi:SAM-dependent methyltransferase [Thermococcus profundus]|uniref:SAM-dependent methyltransferase n=1 Tax=Thermococcus profundus TaxID=49899 RepID=A0A2Z2M8M8_THEPR|nr:class I SAM-dependent methyltransferase [Thermococcus profundus]ASJ02647.1 SAM-dependent methyltransferase [Thermococcus profundus]
MSLEELYKYARNYMDPKNEGARRRFKGLVEFFKTLDLPRGGRILDLCAGTGIVGAALAKATEAKRLTLVDLRRKDLGRVCEWLEIGGVKVDVETVEGDIRELPELVGEHDIATLFGNSMIHFDPFDAVKIFSGVASVLSDDGIFMIEDTDRVYRFLYLVGYKEFFVEQREEDYSLASVHEGYDIRRGTFRRGYYLLPGFKKVGTFDYHHWDLATQLAIGSIFFREYRMILPSEHGFSNVGHVLVFEEPKESL